MSCINTFKKADGREYLVVQWRQKKKRFQKYIGVNNAENQVIAEELLESIQEQTNPMLTKVITLSEGMRLYYEEKDEKFSEYTLRRSKAVMSKLYDVIGDVLVKDITKEKLDEIIPQICSETGLVPTTNIIRAFLNWLYERDLIYSNPLRKPRAKKSE